LTERGKKDRSREEEECSREGEKERRNVIKTAHFSMEPKTHKQEIKASSNVGDTQRGG